MNKRHLTMVLLGTLSFFPFTGCGCMMEDIRNENRTRRSQEAYRLRQAGDMTPAERELYERHEEEQKRKEEKTIYIK